MSNTSLAAGMEIQFISTHGDIQGKAGDQFEEGNIRDLF